MGRDEKLADQKKKRPGTLLHDPGNDLEQIVSQQEESCVRSLGPLTDPLFLLFNTRVWKSVTGFLWQIRRTVGKAFRQGGLASFVQEQPDVMCCCAGGHCIALQRARSLSISFLWHRALDPHPLVPVLWGVPSRNLVLGKSELFLEKLMFL